MRQKDVAELIGTSEDAVNYWENNKNQPQIHYYPKVIAFLGYFPFSIDTSKLGGRIMEYRFRNGITHKRLGKLIRVHGSTINDWEKGKNKPKEAYLIKLLELIK